MKKEAVEENGSTERAVGLIKLLVDKQSLKITSKEVEAFYNKEITKLEKSRKDELKKISVKLRATELDNILISDISKALETFEIEYGAKKTEALERGLDYLGNITELGHEMLSEESIVKFYQSEFEDFPQVTTSEELVKFHPTILHHFTQDLKEVLGCYDAKGKLKTKTAPLVRAMKLLRKFVATPDDVREENIYPLYQSELPETFGSFTYQNMLENDIIRNNFSKRLNGDLKQLSDFFGANVEGKGVKSNRTYGLSAFPSGEVFQYINLIEALHTKNEILPHAIKGENRDNKIITTSEAKKGGSNLYGIEKQEVEAVATDWLDIIFTSITNGKRITFEYKRFCNSDKTYHNVLPLTLKQYRNRWYLLADKAKVEEIGVDKFRTFALDRILKIEPEKATGFDLYSKKQKEKRQKADTFFKHAFGIITGDERGEIIPTLIQLKFNKEQASYVETLPLHSSQKFIRRDLNTGELVVEIFVYPTHDLKMEILSMGANVEVIEPDWLRKDIKQRIDDALAKYK